MRFTIVMTSTCILMLTSAVSWAQAGAPTPLREVREIEVDAAKENGRITSLLGVNCGPVTWNRETDEVAKDFVQSYKELGIDSIRTHDFYGPTDWHVIFPNWDADPETESSYDFASSDKRILAIANNGFEVFYRVGVSWRGRRTWYSNDPPGTKRDEAGNVVHVADTKDFEKFADICKHIVMHYNAGWDNGHHLGIKYWEIWNEPSLYREFWTGTEQQFLEMFGITAKALKRYDHRLKIGGPGEAEHFSFTFREGLIAYCAENRVPLDFYSWHRYGERGAYNPFQMYTDNLSVRALLDKYGYKKAETICSEWNYGIGQGTEEASTTSAAAAYYAATLIMLLDSGCSRAYQYRGDAFGGNLGLRTMDGTLKKSANAFRAYKMMLDTPIRVAANGTDSRGGAVLAGKSADGKRVRVLISDYQSRYRGFKLSLKNLPGRGSAPVTWRRYLIDEEHNLDPVESGQTARDALVIDLPMTKETVSLVEIEA